jgi:hypothetical protein
VVSGQLLQKPRMKSSGVCVVSCTAFRGSDRFTAIVLIRQRQVSFVTYRTRHIQNILLTLPLIIKVLAGTFA